LLLLPHFTIPSQLL